jgi:hypothetical protein
MLRPRDEPFLKRKRKNAEVKAKRKRSKARKEPRQKWPASPPDR